ELAGDTWKICFTLTGKHRPKEFVTTPGSGLALETLTRGNAATMEAAPALAAAAVQPAATADAPEGDPAPELDGEWQMEKCVMNGDALPVSLAKMGRRAATASEVAVTMGPQTILKARYAVDRSREPKTMDYVLAYGPASGKRQYGIYEFANG